ncbi:hypothetical protein A2U01_0081094, partial [Trifolium medium]|nr:hypothetical protein [Trifolium medium]
FLLLCEVRSNSGDDGKRVAIDSGDDGGLHGGGLGGGLS